MAKRKKKKFEFLLSVPAAPNWIKRADDVCSVSIYDLPISQLRKLGNAFTNNLIQMRKHGINGKFVKIV